jgi:hypothetical protein
MKKAISVMFFICLCLAVSVVFPRLSLSRLLVDSSGCFECHSSVELHSGATHATDCTACHETSAGSDPVEAFNCLACHPGQMPGTNADKCDLIEFHEDNSDYEPMGPSCFSSTECHLNECNGGPTTTTTTAPATTSEPDSTCPSEEIYGESSLEVTLLRAVRDTVLSQTPEGREIIKLYYQWSPVITMALRNDKAFKAEMKELLDGILSLTIE